MTERAPQAGMPKWLLYGLIGKLFLIAAIVLGVLWYTGALG